MLTEARKGEIALALLKDQIRSKGIRFGKDTRRHLNQEAKDANIPPDEMLEFTEGLCRELLDETFGKDSSKRDPCDP